MVPEPDPYDQSTTAAQRNNFYDPYPTAMTDRSPNKMRRGPAHAGRRREAGSHRLHLVPDRRGLVRVPDPCDPDAGAMNCGIDFQWLQPVSNVKVAVFILSADTLLPDESFAYSGTVPPASPVTGSLDNSSCSTCSFGTAGKSAYVHIYGSPREGLGLQQRREVQLQDHERDAGLPGASATAPAT